MSAQRQSALVAAGAGRSAWLGRACSCRGAGWLRVCVSCVHSWGVYVRVHVVSGRWRSRRGSVGLPRYETALRVGLTEGRAPQFGTCTLRPLQPCQENR
jgi:hypothetical protein